MLFPDLKTGQFDSNYNLSKYVFFLAGQVFFAKQTHFIRRLDSKHDNE